MNRKLPILIGGLLVALVVVGAVGATVAYAQDTNPPGRPDDGSGPRGMRGLGQVELQAAADALGMTTDDLTSALQSGKTLEEIAEGAGVDYQTVQDAISAAHQEEMRTRIEQGLADGTISQEKADWLLEGLEKGFLDGPGFGFGFGGPHGQRNEPPAQADTTTGQ